MGTRYLFTARNDLTFSVGRRVAIAHLLAIRRPDLYKGQKFYCNCIYSKFPCQEFKRGVQIHSIQNSSSYQKDEPITKDAKERQIVLRGG